MPIQHGEKRAKVIKTEIVRKTVQRAHEKLLRRMKQKKRKSGEKLKQDKISERSM